MPRNVYIDTVTERVRVDKHTPSHSFSENTEELHTVVRKTTVIKDGPKARKRRSKVKKAFRRFLKRTGLIRLASPIKQLMSKFADFAYNGKNLKLSAAKTRGANFGYKVWQYVLNFMRVAWLTIYGILRLIMPIVTPLCGVAIVIYSVWWLSTHSVAISIKMGAETIGYLESSSAYEEISTKLAESVVHRTGEEYTMDTPSTIGLEIISNDEFSDPEDVYSAIQKVVDDYIGQYYGFFLDGQMIASARSETVFSKLESELVSYYLSGEEGETYKIVNDIEVLRDTYSKNYIMDYDDLLELFTKPTTDQMYTVKKGDTISSIAEEFNLSVPVLKLINGDPDLTVSRGDVIKVGKPSLQLTVQTIRTVTYTEVIPYTTKYVQTDDLYENQTQVKNKGSNGSYSVTAEVRSVNGIEISRTELSKTKTKDAVSQQILVGTKKIAPSGTFIFPLKASGFGRISSNFGWRTLRGKSDFHRGLDLAAAYGTPIYAADAGTVVEKGYSEAGLGNYVKIDHGNGIWTIYGHSSSIAKGIKVGVKVYQGQTIAYVGSTGNSTGNHLHFAVYNPKTKEYMDPLPYIKNKMP